MLLRDHSKLQFNHPIVQGMVSFGFYGDKYNPIANDKEHWNVIPGGFCRRVLILYASTLSSFHY